MKTVCILATLLASAGAFAPSASRQHQSTVALNADYSQEVGAQAPLGFFDPVGLLDDATDAQFYRLREQEVRHGRVAMLAVAGYLTTAAGIRLPGMEGVGSGFKALTSIADQPMEVRGVVPLTLGTIFILTLAMQDVTGTAEFPGDWRNGYIDFGWDEQSPEWKKRKMGIELNNGRAAQMGILGIMTHEALGNLNDIGLPQP